MLFFLCTIVVNKVENIVSVLFSNYVFLAVRGALVVTCYRRCVAYSFLQLNSLLEVTFYGDFCRDVIEIIKIHTSILVLLAKSIQCVISKMLDFSLEAALKRRKMPQFRNIQNAAQVHKY